jgi:hypothetical protein
VKFTFTNELRQAVSQSNAPVELQDSDSDRLYYLISADQYEKLKRVLEAEEIDPSFFEFEDEDFDSRAANHG